MRKPLRFIEIRLYKLKPGMRERFHEVARDGAIPMLARHKISVLGYGPSAHDPDSYFLIRAYPSLEARSESLEAFYGSEEWKPRYEPTVMGMIETFNTVVLDSRDPALAAIGRLAG